MIIISLYDYEGNIQARGRVVGVSLFTLLLVVCLIITTATASLLILTIRAKKKQDTQLLEIRMKFRQIPGMEEENTYEPLESVNTIQNTFYSAM